MMEDEKLEQRYKLLVGRLAKPGPQILLEMTQLQADLWHHWTGLATEVGELGDIVKKLVIYQRAPDLTHLVEELGDIEFYLEGIRQNVGVTREQCLEANIQKLMQRYPQYEYTNRDAIKRADKKEKE